MGEDGRVPASVECDSRLGPASWGSIYKYAVLGAQMADHKPGRTVITLEAILPPRPTTPVQTSSTLPLIKGLGHRNYSCPGCKRIVLEGIESNEIEKTAIFRCPQCGAHSRLPFGR